MNTILESEQLSQAAAPGTPEQLEWALLALAQLQGEPLERLRLQAALAALSKEDDPSCISALCNMLDISAPLSMSTPDRARLPLLTRSEAFGWVILIDQLPAGSWQVMTPSGTMRLEPQELRSALFALSFSRDGSAEGSRDSERGKTSFSQIMRSTMRAYRANITEAVVASMFVGALALMTSLFSMQVYDRVIPTQGEYTLMVLGVGVLLSVVIEMVLKFVRSHIMDHVTAGVDEKLSREIFQRLLQLRVDQIPASVGSLAGQLRGYEQIRNFFTASTLFALVDLPMGLFFLLVIAVIASPYVALVPLVFACISVAIGVVARRRVDYLAESGAKYSNLKTGLLVEAVEGVETIKSGSGGWKFLSRWLKLNRTTIANDLSMRRNSEAVSYIAAALQQLGYAGVVVVGALVVMKGEMTMGALIASSIMCSRVLSPILMLPSLFVQHAHARAALIGLDRLYQLKTDNEGLQRVLIPQKLEGRYSLNRAEFSYDPQTDPALVVEKLEINPGERIGVIGPIGSGKSTLLRLLSGMYTPSQGKVLLDGLDLSHISRDVINRHVGYLQQEHRLFQGTLRENLLIGLPDPGDEVLLGVMRRTGMDKLVSSHPQGLERPIVEGGKGLSGGQRQLLAFTRLMLTKPQILLLDEPTANLDQKQEAQCLAVLKEEADAGLGMIIVTHKPALLPLVDRILVVVGNQIIMDGPSEAILQAFAQTRVPATAQKPNAPPAPTLIRATVQKVAA
ncbi:MAG TPA: ATP-binding cassette domain-containing protein [Hydrogenophaga sp.]